jgi:GT2 family glycosyltransferase
MSVFVSVIIPNHNGENFLNDCFESLEAQTYKNFEIILVDNGSDDNSVNFVKKNFPVIKIIANKKNVGFAEANNQGFKIAKGDYIATLNNDTRADKKWLENLILAAEKDVQIGMCASKILSIKKPLQIDSVGVNICLDGMTRGRARLEMDEGQYNTPHEVLLPSACAALYRKKMLDEIGLFDESFFAYCEDTDLGLRGQLAGWKAFLAPDAVIYHHYSSTGGKYSSLKAYLVERNHVWVAIKNFPIELLVLYPFFTMYRFFLQGCAYLTKKGATSELLSKVSFSDALKIVINAYLDTLKKLPELIKKRRIINKGKKITRKEFYLLLKKYKLTFKELVFRK